MNDEHRYHCKCLIALHIIQVVKYRKKLLIGGMGEEVKGLLLTLSEVSDFDIEETEVDGDHIHALIRMSPKYSISQHVRRIKQSITQALRVNHPELKNHFWREKTFFSDGYFCCSVGNASAETIRKYISEQAQSIHPSGSLS